MANDQTEATSVLWEQAKAAVDQQNAAFDALRNRAVGLLSVAALVGGLFGSRLPHSPSDLNVGGLVAALTLFASSVVLAVVAAWPRSWYFGADIDQLTNGVAEGTVTLAQVNLSLTQRAEQNWIENERTMTRLYQIFAFLCVAIGLQLVAWAIAVV